MAAPLRMSFSPKFFQVSRFSTRTRSLRDCEKVFKSASRRSIHSDRKSAFIRPPVRNEKWVKLGAGVLVATAGVTTVVTFGLMATPIYDIVKKNVSVSAAESKAEKPNHKISREIKSSTDDSGLKLTLYQYQTCPFCCKVRAFLDYHGLSYKVVEVNSVSRKQLKWTDYPKVPILVVEDVGENGFLQLNDSSMIISILRTYLFHRQNGSYQPIEHIHRCYPVMETKQKKKTVYEYPNKYFIMYFDQDPGQSKEMYKEERKWRAWSDNTFVHSLSPNIYRTPAEALKSFQYFSKAGNWESEFSAWERAVVVYVGSIAMYFVGKILKRRHNLDADVRTSLYRETNVWLKAVGNKRRFMGGDTPNLADLAVYGSLVAIQGCDAFNDLMENTKLRPWFSAMSEVVNSHDGYKMAAGGKH